MTNLEIGLLVIIVLLVIWVLSAVLKVDKFTRKIRDKDNILDELTQYFGIIDDTLIIDEVKDDLRKKRDLERKIEIYKTHAYNLTEYFGVNDIKFVLWEIKLLTEAQTKDIKEIKSDHAKEVKKLNEKYTNDFKTKTDNNNKYFKELKEKYDKWLDEQNALIDDWKARLKTVSAKLNKLVTFIIKQNPDEDVEKMVMEFDAFYVINAALIKHQRVNENQAKIHAWHTKSHQAAVRTHKRIYDRLRTVCTKHNEPIEIKKQKPRKTKKIKNNWPRK